ncbi:MAG: hypothetical protein IH949_12670, partial [Bacteroidetes bacterium]|nr:hypothetical protein [Bacteroidota bacterium]
MAKTNKQNIILENLVPADVKPPYAPEVEASVLGAMLIEKEAVPKAIEFLTTASFYLKEHKLIFEAMLSLFNASEPIDTVTLYEELKKLSKKFKLKAILVHSGGWKKLEKQKVSKK